MSRALALRLSAACLILIASTATAQEAVITWRDPISFKGKATAEASVRDRVTGQTKRVSLDSAVRLLSLDPANIRNPYTPVPATAGTKKYIILGCAFSDVPAPWDINLAKSMFNDDAISVKGYWAEVSGGAFTFTADADDWKPLPSPRSTYVNDVSGVLNLTAVSNDCITTHDATVDFSQYDGIVFQLSGSTGCCAVAGDIVTSSDGPLRGLKVIYVPGNIAHPKGIVGTYTHELGHNLGLLHTASADEGAYTARWNVMADAFAGDEGGYRFGAQILAAQKEQLGWVPRSRVFLAAGATSTITIERNASPGNNANYQVAYIPIGASEHFYVIELRKAVAGTYDRIIPREGVLIHDWYMPFTIPWASKIVDVDGNGDPNDDGATWVAGETFLDAGNRISVTVDAISATSATLTIRNGGGIAFYAPVNGLKRTVVAGAAAVLDSVAIRFDGAAGGAFGWFAQVQPRRDVAPKSPWLRITNPSGNGSGYIRIRHDPAGLGAGVFVDSIEVTSATFNKRILIYDTLEVTAPANLHIGFNFRSHSDSVVPPHASQVWPRVMVSGPGASSATWTVAARRSTTSFVILHAGGATGTGSDSISYARHTDAEPVPAPGIYVDTITATLTATGQVAMLIDTLKVLPPAQFTTPLRQGKRRTLAVGAPPVLDSAQVTFAGQHATSAEWFVEARGPGGQPKHNFILNPQRNYQTYVLGNGVWRGVGNSWFRYYRGNIERDVGTYIDTLYVTQAFAGTDANSVAGTQFVIDTLEITPVARAMTFDPPFRYDTVYVGMSATTDSVRPLVTGALQGTPWQATARGTRDVVNYMGSSTRGSNVYPNAVSWQRDLTGLIPGQVYVDTIDVHTTEGALAQGFFVDTFLVAAPTALQLPNARVTRRAVGLPNAPDSLDVQLIGTGGSSIAWTATKKQSWTTLTTATGTGSGKVRWTRGSQGLAVGLYIDTITVSANGGSVAAQRFIDTMRVVPAIALSLSENSRKGTPGGPLGVLDSVTITLANGPFVNWTVTKKQPWNTLPTALGSGTSKLFWTRTAGSLAAGTYVDTITVTELETNLSVSVIDTLVVSTPTTLAVPASRRRNVLVNVSSPVPDSADVSLTGPLAAAVKWTALSKRTSTTLTTSSGTGPGKVRWTAIPSGTFAAVIDTITITASDGVVGGTIVDTLSSVAGFVVASSTSRRGSATAGHAPLTDSVTISITGFSTSAMWTATKRKPWTTLTTATGLNPDKLRWSRTPGALSPGIYVDTITIATDPGLNHLPTTVIDTLVITGAVVASSTSRRTTAAIGQAPITDSVTVTIPGTGSSTEWAATKRQAWTTLTTATGTNGGKLRWTRTPGTLVPGTYVDTITIAGTAGADLAPTAVIDTLVITGAIVTSSNSRRADAVSGQAPVSDSVTITIPGSGTPPWTATKRQAWTTLTTPSGTSGGKVRWRRSPGALFPGTYVDTITITTAPEANIPPARIVDTLVVTPPTVFAQASITPDSSGVVVGMGVAATLSIDLAAISKSLANYAAAVVWDSTFMRFDSARAVNGGFVAPSATVNNLGQVTVSATDPAGKSGSVSLARLFFHVIADAPAGGVQTLITPAFIAAASIASQETNILPAITLKTAKVVHLAGALRGDVTLDGQVTQADAQALVRGIVGALPAGSRLGLNGDANCDGKVNAADARVILRKLAGQDVAALCVGTIKP